MNRDKRLHILRDARQTSNTLDYILFQNEYRMYPVVNIPLNLPNYRIENGRLNVVKSEYLLERNLGPEFFQDAGDSAEIQEILHGLLVRMAQDPEADIYRELCNTGLQTDRLLLTGDGIVLDGNRRLAAMRDLTRNDPDRYSGFSSIEAVVLPEDATPIDLEMVEATRQMAPDLKLAYGWIDRRLKLRYHRDHLRLPVEQICRAYRLATGQKLSNEIDELELAEEYLREYLKQPLHYQAIATAEKLFTALHRQLALIPGGEVQETWKLVGFAMIKEAIPHGGEVSQQHPFATAKPPYAPVPVLELFGGEQNLWPFHSDLGTGAVLKPGDYRILVQALKPANRSAVIAESFTRLFNQILTENDERPHPIAIINRLRQINQMLSRIELDKFTGSQRRELFSQLAETAFQFRNLTGKRDADTQHPRRGARFGELLRRWISRLGGR